MSQKIGEMLVKAGVITTAQLDECLKCQVIFGGRLGTNLIEMGYISESDLTQFLSRKLGVPCADVNMIAALPPEIVNLIPLELVQKYKIMPVQLEKKRLTLAMMDPSDIKAIDEISFRTGFIIIPVVVPELRLILALEKYYNIPRETRYINIAGSNRGRAQTADQGANRHPSASPSLDQVSQNAVEEPDLIDIGEFSGFHHGAEEAPQVTLPPRATLAPTSPVEEPEEEVEDIEALDALEALSQTLAEARDRDEIAEAVIEYAASEFERTAIFMIKGKTATGWMAVVKGEKVESFGHVMVPLDAPSVIKLVAEGKSLYLGPIPDTPCNSILLNGLGGGKREGALLIPLLLMGKVVAVLFVDGGNQELNLRLSEMKKIVIKASLAFEILILKNKILSA